MKIVLKVISAVLAIAAIALAGFVVDAQVRISAEEIIAPDEGAPGRFVTVDAQKLHVATIGDINADTQSGARVVPILMLHGGGIQGHAAWLPWASKLTVGHSLILPDLPGFGHSVRIVTPGPAYTLKGQVSALAAILDDLGVPQVDIVGNGLGGAVAAQFALDYPARVRRIVFIDAAVYAGQISSGPGSIQTGVDMIDRALTWHYQAGGPRGKIARACAAQPNCRWMRLARIKDSTDALRAFARTPDEARTALAQNISSITAPALVIWGGNDKDTPVADGDRLSRALNAPLSIIAEAGDMPFTAQPDKVAQRVLDFLK